MKTKLMTKIATMAAFILGAGFALDAAAGTPNFAPQQTFTVGGAPMAVATADFNGDGMPDLVTANSIDGTVSVLMNIANPGDSAPNYAPVQTFAASPGASFVTTGDLNGDGKPDIIVLSNLTGTVTVLLNTTPNGAAQASFAPALTMPVGFFPQMAVVADINGDGSPDIIVSNYGDSSISVLLNTTPNGAPQASFAAQQVFYPSGCPYVLQVADMNGDGMLDILVTEVGSNSVSLLLNTTTPGSANVSFADQIDFTVGDFPAGIAVADLNGDGLPDIAVINEADNTVSVLLNTTQSGDPAPSFADQQVIPVGNAPEAIVAADVDGDGNPDLLVLNYDDNDVMTLTNATQQGSMTFDFSQQTFGIGSEAFSLALGDVNQDGQIDIVAANSMDNTVSVLLNASH